MNATPLLPLAFSDVASGAQLLVLFFAGWALVMFLVLHLDGHRAK